MLIYKHLAPSRCDFLHLPLSIRQHNQVRLAVKGSWLLLPSSSVNGIYEFNTRSEGREPSFFTLSSRRVLQGHPALHLGAH